MGKHQNSYSSFVVSLDSLEALFFLFLAVGFAQANPIRLDFSQSPLERVLSRIRIKELPCPKANQPPEIDGKLDDASWRVAALIEDFSLTHPPTWARVCHDDNSLYIAVKCVRVHGREPVTKVSKQDDLPYEDDRIEISIDNSQKKDEQFRFMVTYSGVVYDAITRGRARYPSYNAEWSHAVHSEKDAWTVEVALPLKAIGRTEWHSRIGFNVGRDTPGFGESAWVDPFRDATRSFLLFGNARPTAAPISWPEPAAEESHRTITEGDALQVTFERTVLRPGERWLTGRARLLGDLNLKSIRLRASLFALGGGRPVGEATATPVRHAGQISLDLRSNRIRRGRLVVELFQEDERIGLSEVFVSAEECPAPLRDGKKIKVIIDPPQGADTVETWPVTFGAPFPAGALWDADRLRLVDGIGKEIPCQKDVTAKWAPDGSIKWVRFDANVSSKSDCFVEVRSASAKPDQGVRVVAEPDRVIVDNRLSRFVLGRGPSPVVEVQQNGKRIAWAGEGSARGLYVIDQKGRAAVASAKDETMQIETRGPMSACVRFEGYYRTKAGEDLARHITRVEVAAGQPYAKVTHTLILIHDTNQVWFKDIGWELAVTPGASPTAIFGSSLADPLKTVTVPITKGSSSWMMQDSHRRFAKGKNHFYIGNQKAAGEPQTVHEGEECADWAMVSGTEGGFAVSCKAMAWQHPKEAEFTPGKMVLRLFSNRHGQELDFRMETLAKKWGLAEWFREQLPGSPEKADAHFKKIMAFTSNAIGWAKTHEITFMPLQPKTSIDQIARIQHLLSKGVFAIVDPAWICSSGVVAPMHPKDEKRFPILEKVIASGLKGELEGQAAWGDFGFIDYAAGPHYRHDWWRRYFTTYTLRSDMWRCYARSGDRGFREFIEPSDRAYIDNFFSHWDGAGRIRGLLHTGGAKHALPMAWEGTVALQRSSTTNFHNLMWMYYLTGYRRAADLIHLHAENVKRLWSPGKARQEWRVIMLFRLLVQAHSFTWDPELLAMAHATADQFEDKEGEIGLTKKRPLTRSTYKTNVDVRALIEAWNITGSPRYRDMALKVSDFWWQTLLGGDPIIYTNPQGVAGALLYETTGESQYAQALSIQVRQAAKRWDPEKNHLNTAGRSAGTFFYEGIPYAQKVIMDAGGPDKRFTSWAGHDDFGSSTSIVVRKGDEDAIKIAIKNHATVTPPGGMAALSVRGINLKRETGQAFKSIATTGANVTRVSLPKDAAAGEYEIVLPKGGKYFALAHSRAPLVLYAPGYWKPMPETSPPIRWYFHLPEETEGAQILFEGTARLFDPSGKAV
ncbi:MAG: sugar-binding protein, partial [Planctomycetota bacterium]|nr:sugar-binding protein [Planctomycetota bacterium]